MPARRGGRRPGPCGVGAVGRAHDRCGAAARGGRLDRARTNRDGVPSRLRRGKRGWGTWIRTRTSGSRAQRSTVELSPSGMIPGARADREGATERQARDGLRARRIDPLDPHPSIGLSSGSEPRRSERRPVGNARDRRFIVAAIHPDREGGRNRAGIEEAQGASRRRRVLTPGTAARHVEPFLRTAPAEQRTRKAGGLRPSPRDPRLHPRPGRGKRFRWVMCDLRAVRTQRSQGG